MKRQREILIGACVLIVGFIIGILVAFFVVENNVPSKASNDGWLGFFGGLFGSFISGMITFYVLYINRRDTKEEIFRRQTISEMDKMENDLKEVFSMLKIENERNKASTYFLFILSKIPDKYRDTKYYKLLSDVYDYCKMKKFADALVFETKLCNEFLKYKEIYINEY